MGVANQRSLAWHCALHLSETYPQYYDHIILTYQNDRFRKNVEALVKQNNNHQKIIQPSTSTTTTEEEQTTTRRRRVEMSCVECNVMDESSLENLFDKIILETNESMGFQTLIHSIAYAPPEAMWKQHCS